MLKLLRKRKPNTTILTYISKLVCFVVSYEAQTDQNAIFFLVLVLKGFVIL